MNTTERAVESLCNIINRDMQPMWIVDSTSGVRPDNLKDFQHGVVVAHPNTRVEVIHSDVNVKMLGQAVDAVSSYVLSQCPRTEDTE